MKSVKNLTRVLTAITLMAIFTFISCKKEQSAGGTAEQQQEFATVTSESNAEAEGVFDDVFDNVLGVNTEVGVGGTGVFGIANPGNRNDEPLSGVAGMDSTACFVVTITQLTANRFPLQITIDFGAGCTGRDGRTRKGKITTVYTGPLHIPGNSSTTTFDGYYVNDIHVEGTFKITNQSTQDKKAFNIQVLDAKLTRSNGDYIQWNSEKTIAQVEGLGTPFYPLDDVFNITGNNNGAVQKGDRFFQWSTTISEALVKRFTCRWFVKGVVILKKSNAKVAELNYGSGDCDNKATLTVDGQTVEITLH